MTDADYLDYAELLTKPNNARHEFLKIMMSMLDLSNQPLSNALTFAYAVVGGPWRLEWNEPSDSVDREGQASTALRIAMDTARVKAPGFAPAGFHPDAGPGYQSAHWPRHSELRLYEREPVVIGLQTVLADEFSNVWFEQILLGTIHAAASAFQQLHPELRIAGTCWRAVNEREAVLRRTDLPEGENEFDSEEGEADLRVCSHLGAIGEMVSDVDAFGESQRARFITTLLQKYCVLKTH